MIFRANGATCDEKLLRGIIAEEIKRLSEGPFAGGKVSHLITTDDRVHEAIANLIGAVVEVAEDRGVWDANRHDLADLTHESLWNDVMEGIEDIMEQIANMPEDKPFGESQKYSVKQALSEIDMMHMDEEDVDEHDAELPPMHPRSRPEAPGPRAAERTPEEMLGKPTTAPRKDRFGGSMGGGYPGPGGAEPELPPMHPRMHRK